MAQRDYYEVLGVRRSATDEDIRNAYRKLARRYHPDVNKDADAHDRFTEVQEAYDVLSDAEKRELYDRAGHAGVKSGANAQGSRGPRVDFGGMGGMEDLGSMFDAFFGGQRTGGPFGQAARNHRPPPRRARQQVKHDLSVSFERAILGGTESVALRRSGEERRVEIKIPPGVEDGQTLRVRLEDEQADLMFRVRVGTHPLWRRVTGSARDLELALPITAAEALDGATIEVPTPTGRVALAIPAGASGGQKLRLRGRGAPASGKHEAGDLFAVLRITLPQADTLTADELDAVRAWSSRQPTLRTGDAWQR